MANGGLTVFYHRDFDGMCAGAILTHILRDRGEQGVRLESVNYDQRTDWENFSSGERFAIVDFHFHPRAEYWFDHHPTTFLSPALRESYEPSEHWAWDETSPSCPPMILAHASSTGGTRPRSAFVRWPTGRTSSMLRDSRAWTRPCSAMILPCA